MNSHHDEQEGQISEVLGIGIHAISYPALCKKIAEWIKDRSVAKSCYYVNPHSIVMTSSDSTFREAIQSADLVMADGAGVILASKILGLPLRERVSGPTSMLKVIEFGREHSFRHYFFGASEECLGKLSQNILQKYPDAAIVGSESPPFREVSDEETSAMVQRINDSGANVLWVGLGAPKQEKWIADNQDKLNVNVVLGVGAAFDYHAGLVKWPPEWIRRIGLEWAYRFVQQPKRLLRRNLNIFVFLTRVLGSRISKAK